MAHLKYGFLLGVWASFFAIEANAIECRIVDQSTKNYLKSDDYGDLREVEFSEVKILGPLSPDRALEIAKYEAERIYETKESDQVEVKVYLSTIELQRDDLAAYVVYTPYPRRLSFRKSNWEGWEAIDPEKYRRVNDEVIDEINARGGCAGR
ncbi:hypothetical protein [Roseibium sp. TrichSKD4]|uniref:hypothetical protein n=1 Tax=Roseibium sp. TrichSKD4 TaxID=744980 RepID=UPI000301CC9A|nr:hypothetical protein [Roseibium sp. TrichSKD4]